MYQKNLTIDQCVKYFNHPIDKVTKLLNVSRPTISKVVRKYGIMRWPYRDFQARGVVWTPQKQQLCLDQLKRDHANNLINPVSSSSDEENNERIGTSSSNRSPLPSAPKKTDNDIVSSEPVTKASSSNSNSNTSPSPAPTIPKKIYAHYAYAYVNFSPPPTAETTSSTSTIELSLLCERTTTILAAASPPRNRICTVKDD